MLLNHKDNITEFPVNTKCFLINKIHSQNPKVICVATFKNIQEVITNDF